MTLGRWLAAYTLFPYPLATDILVVVAAVSFPAVSRWVTTRLDGLLFRAERQQREVVHCLAEVLAETPAPAKIALLGRLFQVLLTWESFMEADEEPYIALVKGVPLPPAQRRWLRVRR